VHVVAVGPGVDSAFLTSFLEPLVDAPVVARHRGIVRGVRVREGQAVAEGAVLATLEDDEQRLAWERAEALAKQSQAEVERARLLKARGVVSDQELEVAESRAGVARAEAGLARLEFERCTLKAPIAGVVRYARAEPHRIVEEGEELFRVADVSRLRASFYLPPSLCAGLARGQRVGLVPAAGSGREAREGRIRTLNSVADPVTGLEHVEVEVARRGDLEAGEDVRLVLDDDPGAGAGLSGAVLPREGYLERRGDRLFVYRAENDRLRRTEVVLGPLGPDGFPVVSGLSPADLVLASGQAPPAEGTRIVARLAGP
jgi:membrane fusion protein (multidrug efflux system)